MTSASHAEGRQFDPGWVYVSRIGIDRGSILVFAFFSLHAGIRVMMFQAYPQWVRVSKWGVKGVVGFCSVFSHVTTMPHARKIAPNSFANVVVDHSRGGVIGWKSARVRSASGKPQVAIYFITTTFFGLSSRTHGLVAMTSASHAEGRQFDPGWV